MFRGRERRGWAERARAREREREKRGGGGGEEIANETKQTTKEINTHKINNYVKQQIPPQRKTKKHTFSKSLDVGSDPYQLSKSKNKTIGHLQKNTY